MLWLLLMVLALVMMCTSSNAVACVDDVLCVGAYIAEDDEDDDDNDGDVDDEDEEDDDDGSVFDFRGSCNFECERGEVLAFAVLSACVGVGVGVRCVDALTCIWCTSLVSRSTMVCACASAPCQSFDFRP